MSRTRIPTSDINTADYTHVTHETDFQFNAPNHFEVCRESDGSVVSKIDMQENPIKENGVNGCCNEDLLNIVCVRLEWFQASSFKCRENAIALTKIEEALLWLHRRTNKRKLRGVEGTYTV